jgi:hypothetical protein
MMKVGLRTAGGLSALAVMVAMLALPASVAATTNAPIAQTGGMTATLPILGGGVDVTVALDPSGNITGVTVSDPSLAQTKATANVVKFATTDGKTKVTVKAKGSRLSLSAKVTTLAELVGSGNWGADVFGTSIKSMVDYTIGDDGSGNPTVTLGTPAPLPSGATWTPATPKSSTEDGGSRATAGGTFSYQGFVKRLSVTVSVEKGDSEDPGSARLSITLSGKDRQSLSGTLAALAAAGGRSWSAHLCDGTAVSVMYHVNADGTIGYDGVTGPAATATPKDHGLTVRFDGTRVGLTVALKDNGDGTYTLVARGFSGSCGESDSHKSSHVADQHHGSSGDSQAKQASWTRSGTDGRSGDGSASRDQGGFGSGGGSGFGGSGGRDH